MSDCRFEKCRYRPGRFLSWGGLAALVLVFVAAPAAGSSPAMPALSSPQQAASFNLAGKITEVETGKFTVNTEENILFHVKYDDKTDIQRADGSPGSAKDLRVGGWVHVAGDLTESGEIIAAKIILLEHPPKKQ